MNSDRKNTLRGVGEHRLAQACILHHQFDRGVAVADRCPNTRMIRLPPKYAAFRRHRRWRKTAWLPQHRIAHQSPAACRLQQPDVTRCSGEARSPSFPSPSAYLPAVGGTIRCSPAHRTTTAAAAAVFSLSSSQRRRMLATEGTKIRTSASMTKMMVSSRQPTGKAPEKPGPHRRLFGGCFPLLVVHRHRLFPWLHPMRRKTPRNHMHERLVCQSPMIGDCRAFSNLRAFIPMNLGRSALHHATPSRSACHRMCTQTQIRADLSGGADNPFRTILSGPASEFFPVILRNSSICRTTAAEGAGDRARSSAGPAMRPDGPLSLTGAGLQRHGSASGRCR